jgi:hypothetical protein
MSFKLGKLAPKLHEKTLFFEKYLTEVYLPPPVEKVYREYKTPPEAMQMFGNDQYGDCTCAGLANLLILATSHTGNIVIPTLQDVLKAYSDVTGFNPTTGANDNGAAMTDVLEYARKTGICGHKILGWAKIDHTNIVHRKLACQLFGATYVGVNLPASAQSQFIEGKECHWEVVPGSPIEGGHAIIRTGYGAAGDNYVSWANWTVKASAAWSSTYVDEEYVVITSDFLNKSTKKSPGGLDLETLQNDLKALSA